MAKPFVSVVMPVYNAMEYVDSAIKSIIDQTYENYELIIIDDGSTDGSKEIIKSFGDNRIVFIENTKNIKLVETLNKGLDMAKGEFIARMDADDIALPQRFEKQVDYLLKNPQVGVLGTAYESFDAIKKKVFYEINHDDIKWRQLYECHIAHPTVMMRREVIEKYRFRYSEEFLHAEDYDLWTRISQVSEINNLPQILLKYRLNPLGVSSRFKDIQIANSIKIQKRLFSLMGVEEFTTEEILTFMDLCYRNYGSGFDYLQKIEEILNRLIRGNERTGYFHSEFLIGKVHFLWYHACLFNVKLGPEINKIFLKSELSSTSDLIGKFKLFLKAYGMLKKE